MSSAWKQYLQYLEKVSTAVLVSTLSVLESSSLQLQERHWLENKKKQIYPKAIILISTVSTSLARHFMWQTFICAEKVK